MGGIFGVASKTSCTMDLFFGIDYHSHLGTRRGGMAVYGENGFQRAIHNIENTPFRTKFDHDLDELEGTLGIGCISDMDPQPLLIRSHLGTYALTTVGVIRNPEELVKEAYNNGHVHFMSMSGGKINDTELVASLIDQKDSLVDGLLYAQERIQGSMSMLLLTPEGIYASRDRYGRTPITIGQKDGAFCASFENFAYLNLGYRHYSELGPGEIDFITPEGVECLSAPRKEMKMCAFLWPTTAIPPPATKASAWKKCVMTAESSWPEEIRASPPTAWPAYPIPVLHMQWAMPTNPAFPSPAPSSNIRPPGPGPLCPPARSRGTSLLK